MKLNKQKNVSIIPTFVYVTCPSCNKDRLLKERKEDGTVEQVTEDTVTSLGGEERRLDVCDFCQIKFQKQDAKFVRKQVLDLQRAARNIGDNTASDIEL
jgi:DNA-directed RNA polymerase subunit RPC12/RpoP